MTSTDQHQAVPPAPRRAARIRTFHPRRGRLSTRHLDALDRLWPTYGLVIPESPGARLDLPTLFGRRAPVVLEIGSGMGEATVAMAAADVNRDYLAVEVHTPGIANLLAMIEQQGVTNVRIAQGDALDLVRHLLSPQTLDAIHVFFPDPWPKARHHKRRLIQPEHVALLRSRLVPGGTVHCATDWAEYAAAMREVLSADPELVNDHDGYAPRPPHRPVTRFERRGLTAGHQIFDLVFRRG